MSPDRVRPGVPAFPALLGQAMSRRERQLVVLARLSLLASREADLDRILAAATADLRGALSCDFTKVLDSRVSAHGLLVRAGAGWPAGVVGKTELPEGIDSQAGYTLRTAAPVLVDDVTTETRFEPSHQLLRHGIRSSISATISATIAGDPEPVGVLEASSRAPGAFEEEDLLVLGAFADVIAGAVERTEREEASDHFASMAAHELRTPLTLIIGYASRLLGELDRQGSIGAERREELETLHSESLRLRHAVDLFLALGDVDRHHPRVEQRSVDLVEVVEDVLPIVQEHYPEGRFRVEPTDDSTDIVTDGRVVARIVMALLENAAKYTAPGTAVRVTIDGVGEEAVVSVADHCGGLADADLRRLFQRSFQGEHARDERAGLGLGLYIAQRMSEQVQGQLDAENSDDGCIFMLRLPREPGGD